MPYIKMQFEEGRLLKELTTFGIGGPAKYFTQVTSIPELQEVIRFCSEKSLRFFVLGKGSNSLFSDQGFDGVVILNKIHFFEEKEGIFYVGAGYSFSLLGSQTARKGWEGLEFASGIPGTVGGAIFMNAGANGAETFETVVDVTYVNEKGEVEILAKSGLKWGYRHTCFHERRGAIGAARFQLKRSETARQKQLSLIQYRTQTQPYSDLSAGCVFRNTPEASAGKLIQACGLKGLSIGGAEVSTLHANFIINKGHATAEDVVALAGHVQQVVQEKTGHFLEMEIRVIPYN
jgi:UDP-N-acetylmuramate dehydrogenase